MVRDDSVSFVYLMLSNAPQPKEKENEGISFAHHAEIYWCRKHNLILYKKMTSGYYTAMWWPEGENGVWVLMLWKWGSWNFKNLNGEKLKL